MTKAFSPTAPTTLTQQTLKSIQKCSPSFPTTSEAESNPLTLHLVNEEIFPRIWSLLGEVMMVEGALLPGTKEEIAPNLISSKTNRSTRSSLEVHSHKNFDAAVHSQALQFAQLLTQNLKDDTSTFMDMSDHTSISSVAPSLSKGGQAEAALVVLLFDHFNRTSKALLGSFGTDASNCTTAKTSKAAPVGFLKAVVKAMKLSPSSSSRGTEAKAQQSGFTSSLFPSETNRVRAVDHLPEHLQAVQFAGEDCANALGRLVSWVDTFQQQQQQDILTPMVVNIFLHAVPPYQDLTDRQIYQWVSKTATVKALPNLTSQHLARVLMLLRFVPHMVSTSHSWVSLKAAIGKDAATALTLWGSLKLSLSNAKGLQVQKTDKISSQSETTARVRRESNSSVTVAVRRPSL